MQELVDADAACLELEPLLAELLLASIEDFELGALPKEDADFVEVTPPNSLVSIGCVVAG